MILNSSAPVPDRRPGRHFREVQQTIYKLWFLRYGTTIMINPFEYGGVVAADAFCNRQDELKLLNRSVENAEKVFLYSERRMGKTSLLQYFLSKLSPNDYIWVYVDLWPTVNESSFATTLATTVTESIESEMKKALTFAQKYFSRLLPAITLDNSGNARISFGVDKTSFKTPDTKEVLKSIIQISKDNPGKRVVIVLDEIQQILEYPEQTVEKQLRASIQTQRDIAYIFSGSRKHLIQDMITNEKRPFYRSGPHYSLETIETSAWVPFIKKKFLKSKKNIDDDTIVDICNRTQGHPFYTQHFCHALWELASTQKIGFKLLADAEQLLLRREQYTYMSIWESLSSKQRATLLALAKSDEAVQPYSSEFILTHGLKSTSTVQTTLKALLEKDILDFKQGRYSVTDRFFRLWLRQKSQGISF